MNNDILKNRIRRGIVRYYKGTIIYPISHVWMRDVNLKIRNLEKSPVSISDSPLSLYLYYYILKKNNIVHFHPIMQLRMYKLLMSNSSSISEIFKLFELDKDD